MTIDVAMAHSLAQRVWRHVDQFHFVGFVHHPIRNPLADLNAGNVLDDVRQTFQVLNVDRTDDGYARFQEVLNILPPLLVSGSRCVGLCQLVNQGDGRMPLDDSIGIHLLDRHALVRDLLARHRLQACGQFRRPGPAVRLQEADDNVRAALFAAVQLFQRRVGLANT